MTTRIAVLQFSVSEDAAANVERAAALTRRAAAGGAALALLPELFERPYFCKTQRAEFLQYAAPAAQNAAVQRFCALAAELQIVVPVSFYELSGNARFNSVAVIDASGEVLGVYRKSHIPDGPGYQEKFYFSPGDSGFCVWQTQAGKIGVGICWDQWFPEAARAMALAGAEMLLYPTAIGSEPQAPQVDSADHWQTAMRGHAAANMLPVAAANRVGAEGQTDAATGGRVEASYYGRSFVCDSAGAVVADAQDEDGAILYADFDLPKLAEERAAWGLFRDRRPDLYSPLLKLGAQ